MFTWRQRRANGQETNVITRVENFPVAAIDFLCSSNRFMLREAEGKTQREKRGFSQGKVFSPTRLPSSTSDVMDTTLFDGSHSFRCEIINTIPVICGEILTRLILIKKILNYRWLWDGA